MNTEMQGMREEAPAGGNMQTMTLNDGKAKGYSLLHMADVLSGLLENVQEPERTRRGARLPLRDVLFGLIYKVCYQRSYRRTVIELRQAARDGLISIGSVPAESTLRRYMSEPTMTPVLRELVVTSSLPLTAVESGYDHDSAVFAASRHRNPDGLRNRRAGICVDVQVGRSTGVIGAVEPAGEGRVPWKKSPMVSVPDGSLWATLCSRLANWPEVYGSRLVIESAFARIKRRYDDRVRSRSHAGQVNELYCGIIAHNLTVLVYEMFNRKVGLVECGLGGSNGRPAEC